MTKRPKVEISDEALKMLQIEAERRGLKQYEMISILVKEGVSDEVKALVKE